MASELLYDPDVGRFINQDSYLGNSSTPPSLHRYLYAYSNPNLYVDPDGYESVSTTLKDAEDNAGSAMGAFGYRFLSNLYNVGTLGFASVHDPQRDAYDEGKISGGEYLAKGVGGGTAMVAANVLTGRAAGAAMAGKGLAAQSAIGAGTGAVLGAGNDAAVQGSRIGAGQQEEYNVGQTVGAAGAGTVLGGAAPGAGRLVQITANSLSKTKIGNFFTRESKGGPNGANGANQGALKGKSESATRQRDVTAVEVAQASAKTRKVADEVAAIKRIGANNRNASRQLAEDVRKKEAATAWQGEGNKAYPGVDHYPVMKNYKKGDTIYALDPGQGAYHTTKNTVARYGSSARSINESLQVWPSNYKQPAPHIYKYRSSLAKYEVTEDIRVPIGYAKNNPQWGGGGGQQVYIENFKDVTKVVESNKLRGNYTSKKSRRSVRQQNK